MVIRMENKRLSYAAAETLDILKHMKEKDVLKIPKSYIIKLMRIAKKGYKPNLDHSKKLEDMNLRPETQKILGIFYKKYWSNPKD